MAPVWGNAPATSASASAPQSAGAPPTTQTVSRGSGPGKRVAILAGDRKMPEPIVVPMTTATALHKPRRRGSADGGSVAAVVESRMVHMLGRLARSRKDIRRD